MNLFASLCIIIIIIITLEGISTSQIKEVLVGLAQLLLVELKKVVINTIEDTTGVVATR